MRYPNVKLHIGTLGDRFRATQVDVCEIDYSFMGVSLLFFLTS